MWLKIPAARTKLHAFLRFQQQFANLDQIREPCASNSVSKTPLNRETTDGTDKEWRLEARLRSHGSRKAARDRKQGRKGKSRRRPQGEFQPLVEFFFSQRSRRCPR